MREVFGDDETTRAAEQDFLGEGGAKKVKGKSGVETATVAAVFVLFLAVLGWVGVRLVGALAA